MSPRPFNFLHAAAERINSARGTASDYNLLNQGYLVVAQRGDYYVPNSALVAR